MVNKNNIIDAYTRIRAIDSTIPDEVLDYMYNAALGKLKSDENMKQMCETFGVPKRLLGFDPAKEGGDKTVEMTSVIIDDVKPNSHTDFIKQHLNTIEPPQRYLVINTVNGNTYDCVININRHGTAFFVGNHVDKGFPCSIRWKVERVLTDNSITVEGLN